MIHYQKSYFKSSLSHIIEKQRVSPYLILRLLTITEQSRRLDQTCGATWRANGHFIHSSFMPSPCFIPSPQSIFYTDRLFSSLQKDSSNFGWKVNGTRLFRLLEWKSSGNSGTSEKVACFLGRNVPTESDVPFRQTSSLIPFPDSL